MEDRGAEVLCCHPWTPFEIEKGEKSGLSDTESGNDNDRDLGGVGRPVTSSCAKGTSESTMPVALEIIFPAFSCAFLASAC